MNHTTRLPLDLRAALLMLVLCFIWGVQQSLMKSMAADIPPMMQLAVRFIGAAVVFGTLLLVKEGLRGLRDGTAFSGTVLGLLFAGEFVAIGQALEHTTSAHTTAFLYSAPIFTALGVQVFPEERLSLGQWTGIGIAIAGMGIAFLGYTGRPLGEMIQGDVYALIGGAFWGLSTIWLRRTRIGRAQANKTVFYQVAVAAIVISAYAAAQHQTDAHWTPLVVGAMTYQTLVIGVLSYLTWFWLLRHYLTSRLMLFSLLTPLFAVVAGRVVLGEIIELPFLVGTVLVLAGIVTVNARLLFQRA
jgi:drug/metabolite transporter (DMT)-like permease